MSKVIVFENDNGCSVIHPSPNWEGTIEELAEKDVPAGKNYKVIDKSSLPTDRHFRNAWKSEDSKVDVDMVKASVIHLDRIRIARDKKLKELDIETLRGNDVQAEKQVLRDLPGNFDLSGATTPDALKKLWPKEL